jgi:hypothetical protein
MRAATVRGQAARECVAGSARASVQPMRVPFRLKLLAFASVALFVATNLSSLVDLQRTRDAATPVADAATEVLPPAVAPASGERPGIALLSRRAP